MSHTVNSSTMNPWEVEAYQVNSSPFFCLVAVPLLTKAPQQYHYDQTAPTANPLFFHTLYAPGGYDIMGYLVSHFRSLSIIAIGESKAANTL